MSQNRKTNPRQMPLRMLWDYAGHVRASGVSVAPDGTLKAISVEFDGDPGECVEFVRQATGTDDATAEIDGGGKLLNERETPLLPAAGGGK
jgi:hypothetical protein